MHTVARLAISIFIAVSLTACGGGSDFEPATAIQPSQADDPAVAGVDYPVRDDAYFAALNAFETETTDASEEFGGGM